MTFKEAMTAAKGGQSVKRRSWRNGHRIYYVPLTRERYVRPGFKTQDRRHYIATAEEIAATDWEFS